MTLHEQDTLQGHVTLLKLQSVTQLDTIVKSTMTGTVTSSGRGGTAAAMAQNEQTAEEHSMLSHWEDSITQRGASCGRYNHQLRVSRPQSRITHCQIWIYFTKTKPNHRTWKTLREPSDGVYWAHVYTCKCCCWIRSNRCRAMITSRTLSRVRRSSVLRLAAIATRAFSRHSAT